MLIYKKGNLITAALKSEVDCIAHGCNCFCTMGKGIALSIRENFPEAYIEDQKTVRGSRSKLGTLTYVEVNGVLVINAYTQYTYWDVKDMLSYSAVQDCMKEIKKLAHGRKIGLPKIGAGLARGDWSVIENVIEDELEGEDVTIYVL